MLRERQEFVSTVAKHGTALIYMLLNVVNRKMYVGQTVQSVKKRFSQHAVNNCLVGRAIRKHGKAAFKLVVLDVVPFDERDDAVKMMLSLSIDACLKKGKYIGICGQGPSDHSDLADWLLKKNIESMSLNPDTVIDTWFKLAGKKI